MANQNLKNRTYDLDGAKINYQALAMQVSRLKKAQEDCQNKNNCGEFNRLGGTTKLNELEAITKKEQDADYQKKKVGMDAGRENQFIKTHEKDKDNANPTGVGGIPKMNKGSINRKIMSNKEVYNENLNVEISEIRYLIEYMNNNHKKQKL
jgi:hypothetical protein